MHKWIILVFFYVTSVIHAEVVDSSSNGFTVRDLVVIKADSLIVYKHLIKNIGKWWDPEHTFSGLSKNLSIDAKANGCFCEKLDRGGSVRHMTVVYAMPGKMLRMKGGLGPLQALGVDGSLTFLLYPSEKGTVVEMSYTAGGYAPGGLQAWAKPVDSVLLNQLKRLKKFIETGNP